MYLEAGNLVSNMLELKHIWLDCFNTVYLFDFILFVGRYTLVSRKFCFSGDTTLTVQLKGCIL